MVIGDDKMPNQCNYCNPVISYEKTSMYKECITFIRMDLTVFIFYIICFVE